jgi:predicted phage tail protein
MLFLLLLLLLPLTFACLYAARAYQRNAVTPAGAFAVAAASLATLGCSLRFGVVMLAYAYTSHKLRQFREGRQSVDYEVVRKPQQLLPRDWPEVG